MPERASLQADVCKVPSGCQPTSRVVESSSILKRQEESEAEAGQTSKRNPCGSEDLDNFSANFAIGSSYVMWKIGEPVWYLVTIVLTICRSTRTRRVFF